MTQMNADGTDRDDLLARSDDRSSRKRFRCLFPHLRSSASSADLFRPAPKAAGSGRRSGPGVVVLTVGATVTILSPNDEPKNDSRPLSGPEYASACKYP